MFFKKEAQHFSAADIWHGQMLFLVGANQRAERIQQIVERMVVVGADFVQQFVQVCDSQIIFMLVVNAENGANGCPLGLDGIKESTHFFQSPLSYSLCVSTCRM